MKTKLSLLAFLLLPSLVSASYVYRNTMQNTGTGSCANNGIPPERSLYAENDGNYYGWYHISFCIDSGAGYSYIAPSFDLGTCPTNTIPDTQDICTPSCTSGQSFSWKTQSCAILPTPPLSSFNNDPQGCNKAGGYFYSTGTEQVGGTSYGASFFGGAGIVIGGDLKSTTQCGTLIDVVGQVATSALAMIPLASKLFGSMGLKKMANMAYLNKLQALPNLSNKPLALPDTNVGLPKLSPPPTGGGVAPAPTVPIVETPVPTSTNTGGVTGPSRSPTITADTNYQNIPDTFIPIKTSGDPIVDYSVVDRFNSVADLSTSPMLDEIVAPIGSSSKPVKETFDFSQIIANSQTPSTVATVPVTTTKTFTYSGYDPVDLYTTTKTFPDSTTLIQTVKINTITKTGTIDFTTLSPTGETSTIYEPIYVPTYTGTLAPVAVQPPTGTTFSPPTTSTPPVGTTGVTNTTPIGTGVTNPNQISGQSGTDVVNANMPSYAFPDLGKFTPFDSTAVADMMTGTSDLMLNIRNQLTAVKTTFDSTKALLNGSWTPPVIPAGACGDSLTLNWHGRNIDLCPPMAEATSKVSPIVAPIVTLGGMALSISLFLGGF